jgi:hypothetical protein
MSGKQQRNRENRKVRPSQGNLRNTMTRISAAALFTPVKLLAMTLIKIEYLCKRHVVGLQVISH